MAQPAEEKPYAMDFQDYPYALMIEAIHLDDPRRDAYLKARGVRIATPLFMWSQYLGEGLDQPHTFYYSSGSPINNAISLIKADADLPSDAVLQATQAIYDMTFEQSEWAKYLAPPDTEPTNS